MIGERLKKARKIRKLTQEEAAKKMGMVRSTYANYESGKREPDFDTAKKLADFYEVNVGWLLTGENKKESAYALPESEFERIVKEVEEEQNVDLHNNPIAHEAVRNALEIIVKAMKSSE